MNQKKLALVVGLMTLALCGLTGIQIHWMAEGYKLREAQFNMTVGSVLRTVADQLEREGMQQKVHRLMSLMQHEDTLRPMSHAHTAPHALRQQADRADSLWLLEATGSAAPATHPLVTTTHTETRGTTRLSGGWTMNYVTLAETIRVDLNALPERAHKSMRFYMSGTTAAPTAPQPPATPEGNRSVALSPVADPPATPTADAAYQLRQAVEARRRSLQQLESYMNQGMRLVQEDENRHQQLKEALTAAENREKRLQREKALALEDMQRLRHQFESLRHAVYEQYFKPEDINERVKLAEVERMLCSELRCRGIRTPFKLAVVQQEPAAEPEDAPPATPAAASLAQVAGTVTPPAGWTLLAAQGRGDYEYATQLFPNEGHPTPAYLLAAFPSRTEYLLGHNLWLLLSTVVFIGLIVGGFTYTVRTILHQKKLSEMKTDFINNMTHELKTPIATIALSTEAILDKDIQPNPERRDRLLRIVQAENHRLENQVERVLRMAEIDRGELRLALAPVCGNDIVRDAVAKHQLLVEKRAGSLSLEIATTDCHVMADPLHLTNVLDNLLDNANKYSREAPSIHVKTFSTGNWWVCTVQDQGIGMTPEVTKRIWDRFYRVPTGNLHDVKGFGLGLAYVRDLVHAHDGRIEVQSTLGKGSTFTLRLPRTPETTA